jgi:chromosomal replication initiation ATPase DnaA
MNTEDTLVLSPQQTQVQVVESTNPDVQTRRRKIHCKQELIVMSLQTFYSNRKDLPEILELLQGTSAISLRLIDWFVTNYAKRHSIGYLLGGQEFMVYMNYKSQLKAYSKKLFDPFCRRERIMFSLPGIPAFITTVGKLNFFRWAIEKQIIEYLKTHFDTVETEMNAHMKQLSRSRSTRTTTATTVSSESSDKVQQQKRVRTAFQTSPPQTVCRRDVEIKVGFD